MSIPFGQSLNHINEPMYRNDLQERMRNGYRVYELTAVDNDNTDRYVQFQILTPKSVDKIKSELDKKQNELFYSRYLYTPDAMTHVVGEIRELDEIDTSILLCYSERK